jgi:hypothetical protein
VFLFLFPPELTLWRFVCIVFITNDDGQFFQHHKTKGGCYAQIHVGSVDRGGFFSAGCQCLSNVAEL